MQIIEREIKAQPESARPWYKLLCVKFGHNILPLVLRKANLPGIDGKFRARNSDTTF